MFSRNLSRFKLITFDFTQTLVKFARPPHQEYILCANDFLNANDYFDSKLVKKNFRHEFRTMAHKYPNFGYPGMPMNCPQLHRIMKISYMKFQGSQSHLAGSTGGDN